MSGRVGNLSQKQAEALSQFKKNLSDVAKPEYDDYYYLRWLRARRFDLKKSEKMLRDSLAWRKTNDADGILKWNVPEVLVKYFPGGYFGTDKEGSPIWYDTLGTVDLKGMMFSIAQKEIVRYKVYNMEYLYQVLFPKCTKEAGHRVDQHVVIFDMDGIGMKHLWKPAIDTLTDILSVLEANYPETMKVCYIVNAPSIFPIAYNLAKPFLSEDTKSKTKVLGKDWKSHILKNISADQIPKNWGGTCSDPDGDVFCRSKICMGGVIPVSYHMKKLDANVDMSQFTTLTVSKGSSMQLDYDVQELNCIIRWQFWTDSKDIGFGVFYRTGDGRQKAGDMEVVVQSARVNSHIIPEDGSITCNKIGTYVVRFDNTYSWVSSKKVSYMIEVLDPDKSGELEITAL